MNNVMRRLGELDVAERLSPALPPLASQILFGLACSAIAALTRVLVDAFAFAAGPYSLIYPAILLSTLFGRWPSGLATWATSFLFAWYFVLPETHSFAFAAPLDGPRTLVNALASLVILVFAEIFRNAVRRAVAERDQEIETRDLLLREINHRIKNNFAIVASMLNIQMNREENEKARDVLSVAAARVQSFAAAHESLYGHGDAQTVEMNRYLFSLGQSLSQSVLNGDDLKLNVSVEETHLPRDQAISIGLIVNELVTNAAKHAFGDERGRITVEFGDRDGRWRLYVADNGRGIPEGALKSGLGSELIAAFVEKAGGEVFYETSPSGTRVTVRQAENPT